MNSEYKDCQYFFEGKCRCMDSSFNQDFYECPQCRDVPYCYYRQLKKCEQKLEKIKEKCKFFISKCNECENPDITIDCIDCTEGGKAIASYKILNIIEDIEGAEE